MPIDPSIQKEIDDCKRYALNQENMHVEMFGFKIWCDKGLLPPDNTVTKLFAKYLMDVKADKVLDIGCGTGILTFIAAKNAQKVTGVDVDPVAVACSKHNATINNIENIYFKQGCDYEPVSAQMFDLIICNPPFYKIDSTNKYLNMCYTNNTDWLVTKLITKLKDHLTKDGTLLFVTSSKTDNTYIEKLIKDNSLFFNISMLKAKTNSSQGVLLWKVKLNW